MITLNDRLIESKIKYEDLLEKSKRTFCNSIEEHELQNVISLSPFPFDLRIVKSSLILGKYKSISLYKCLICGKYIISDYAEKNKQEVTYEMFEELNRFYIGMFDEYL